MAWISGATTDDDPTGEVAAAFEKDRALSVTSPTTPGCSRTGRRSCADGRG